MSKFGLITLSLACCALTSTAFAANWPSDHHFDRAADSQNSEAPPPSVPDVHHGAPSDVRGAPPAHEFRGPPPDFHDRAPAREFRVPPDFHGQRPARDFRGTPPDFRGAPNDVNSSRPPHSPRELRDRPPQAFDGSAPREFRGPRTRTPSASTPPAVSAFVERHDVSRFSPQQREAWTQGRWHHTWHHGRFGWWWFFDDFWFFYPEPFYPYPTYVGAYYDDEYADDGYADDGDWYWCDDPRGYYPYVQECYGDWLPVPPEPY